MEIRLHATREKLDALNVGERITFEEPEQASMRQLRDLIARFCVDDKNRPLSLKEAQRMLNALSQDALIEAMRGVYQKVNEMAVNPPPAGDSPVQSPASGADRAG